ncbi:alanyl-tRNA editing protein [Polycladidibacter hongkongensis]|uniref:alanyl-tRNA editing protein n=1 Tax=Polycladidibacter hongkongensis TaxID=1647556 RepID=UPI000832C2E8|nr:alanyl-tRNA editing protein [Pseudovibrio hongkongensis]
MTEKLFESDAYLRSCEATLTDVTPEGALVFDRTIFYPQGGGQPGDSGAIELANGDTLTIANTKYSGDRRHIIHIVEGEPTALVHGEKYTLHLDWPRRYALMRSHTALHLLSEAMPYPVTGGQVSEAKGRLDFLLPDADIDRDAITAHLNQLVEEDHPVTQEWISDAQLDANPELVKTMSVQPPRGAGRIRLVRIGEKTDLQPCGGTHVHTTSEIGRLKLGKIESKGKENRRVRIILED